MNSSSIAKTPWDQLSESYLDIERLGHEFPIPARYLPSEGVNVFDLGCGVGTHMRLFLTRSQSVVGIDYSSNMAKLAAKVAPVAQADARHIPFADSSFDYLWSRVVISCVPDWQKAFDEALRVVTPGGKLVLLVSNKWSVMTPFRMILSALGKYSEGYIKHFARNDFENCNSKYTFRVVEAFATQKEARSANPIFLIGAKLFYGIDKLISIAAPWWGGDLCLVIDRY